MLWRFQNQTVLSRKAQGFSGLAPRPLLQLHSQQETCQPTGQRSGVGLETKPTDRCESSAQNYLIETLDLSSGSIPEIKARETYARTTSDSGNRPQHMRLPHRHAGSGQLCPVLRRLRLPGCLWAIRHLSARPPLAGGHGR